MEDIKANPKEFSGKSTEEIAEMLRESGYDVTIKQSTKSHSGAEIIKGGATMKLRENGNTEFKRLYVDDIKKTAIAFVNTLRDSIKPDVMLFSACSAESIDGKNVVVLEIQKGTASPYYIASKGIRPHKLGIF